MANPTTGTLLVVDDNMDLKKLLADRLVQCAGTVRSASSGTEALTLITAGAVDAILCDIRMPDMTGLELLFYLRGLNLETPVVFITGYVDSETSVEALRLGAMDIIEKPFDTKHVVEVMRKAVGLGMAMKEVTAELKELNSSLDFSPAQKERIEKLNKSISWVKTMRLVNLKAA